MNESDRELLELAAKAAGESPSPEPFEHVVDRWNPLTDDGDAFRLMVALELNVFPPDQDDPTAVANYYEKEIHVTAVADVVGDCFLSATRRAIVRAAAEIGRRLL